MPWPAHIVVKSSGLLDTENIENKFYRLYDSILNECFPPNEFTISPKYAGTLEAVTGGRDPIDFAITYFIEPLALESPIFFIEIKPPIHLPSSVGRQDAENQVRYRFWELIDLVRVPKLYDVSALGRQLSFYTYERVSGIVEPVPLSNPAMDTAPIERWNTNVMAEEGHAKFLAVVEEIKEMVAMIEAA